MKKEIVVGLAMITMITMTGCANIDTYKPVVDLSRAPAKTMAQYEEDLNVCRQFAKQRASQTEQTAKGAGIGAAIGAASGAILGALDGGTGAGAAVGAGLGALFGGLGGMSDKTQQQIVVNCLRARGYTVLSY